MKFNAEQIAGLINGEIQGDASAEVETLAKIEEGRPGALSFLANPKYEEYIYSTGSSICIVNTTFIPTKQSQYLIIFVICYMKDHLMPFAGMLTCTPT